MIHTVPWRGQGTRSRTCEVRPWRGARSSSGGGGALEGLKFGFACGVRLLRRDSSPPAAAATTAVAAAAVVAAAPHQPWRRRRTKVEGAKVIDARVAGQARPRARSSTARARTRPAPQRRVVKDFNAKFGAQGYKADADRVPGVGRPAAHPVHPAPAGQVRRLRRLQLRRDLDGGVRQPEVAYDLTPYVQAQKVEVHPAPLETVHYADKYWGVPETSDAAFIYYRDRQGRRRAAATWQEVYAHGQGQGGIVYQGAPYEGLTCDFLELAFAAGGTVPQRRRQEVDDQLARRTSRRCSSWSTASRAARRRRP